MKTKRIVIRGAVLAAALTVVSCANLHDHPQHVPPGGGERVVHPQPSKGGDGKFECPPGDICELTVDIQACTVVEEQTKVRRGQVIRWRAPQGSSFDAAGIRFKVNVAGVLDNPRGGGTAHFHWHVLPSAPSNASGYPYRVVVTGPTGKVCDFDPAIWI